MTATPEYYLSVLEESSTDAESLTWLVVTGATREEVATALSVDLGAPASLDDVSIETTAWIFADLPGGVLAIEHSGYADPHVRALAALSEDGRSAAVARSNIQAHERFGCARDGVLVFDDDEYMFVDDPSVAPDVLRPLFDLAWEDLDSDDEADGDWAGVIVAMAMCEQWTGLQITAADVTRASEGGGFVGPSQAYVQD